MDENQVLRQYILHELLAGRRDVVLTDDTDLLESGLVDSLGVVRLVSFIEERWRIKIPDLEISLANFQSIAAIACYIRRRTGNRAASPPDGKARSGS